MTKRILMVVTNVDHYQADPSHPTGLWLSELTHAYDVFTDRGFEQTLVSPAGGKVPLEPRSLKFPATTGPPVPGTMTRPGWRCSTTPPPPTTSTPPATTRSTSPAGTP